MTAPLTRKQFLRRTAVGGSILTVPGLLEACGGGIKTAKHTSTAAPVTKKLAKTLNFSNWPLYIDVGKNKNHPSLNQFTKKTGVQVNYVEDINDNESFFGKIEGPLSRGQSVHRDIVVMTDSSGLPQRMIKLGWLEKLYKPAIPNISNLIGAQQHPAWDPNRDYSLPWQSGMTGIGYDPNKVGGELTSVTQLLEDPKLKGKVTLLTELADTIGLVILANGDDPTKVTSATFSKAVARIQKAVKSGQIRQFTGNDYAPLLAKGDIWRASPGRGTWSSSTPTTPG
jgi:spermidine/putrescine transport system substrate-binding protein